VYTYDAVGSHERVGFSCQVRALHVCSEREGYRSPARCSCCMCAVSGRGINLLLGARAACVQRAGVIGYDAVLLNDQLCLATCRDNAEATAAHA
jgi:hypothetical protein